MPTGTASAAPPPRAAMTMMPPSDQRDATGHAEDSAGHVGLGYDQRCSREQERNAECGHREVLVSMIRPADGREGAYVRLWLTASMLLPSGSST